MQALTPMILGKVHALDPADQLLVATWAIKTAYVFECAFPDEHTVSTPEQRRYLMEHQAPPPGAYARIGAYDGQRGPLLTIRRIGGPLDDDSGAATVFASTSVIGKVVLQVVHDTTPDYRALESFGAATDLWLPAWPTAIGRAFYPPAVILDDDALEAAARSPFPSATAPWDEPTESTE